MLLYGMNESKASSNRVSDKIQVSNQTFFAPPKSTSEDKTSLVLFLCAMFVIFDIYSSKLNSKASLSHLHHEDKMPFWVLFASTYKFPYASIYTFCNCISCTFSVR